MNPQTSKPGRNHYIAMILLFVLLLSACTPTPTAIPTDVVIEPDTPSATATLVSPSATPDPSPTPTPVPGPLPITSANVGSSLWSALLTWDGSPCGYPDDNWGTAQWNPDGSLLVVQTSLGFDVLDGSTLDLVNSYTGYIPIDMLADGTIAVLSGNELEFLDLGSGDTTSKWTFEDAGVAMGVSPDGKKLAYATGEKTFDLVDLDTSEVRSMEIKRSIAPTGIVDFSFQPDGAIIFVTHKNLPLDPPMIPPNATRSFNVESGTQMYEVINNGPILHFKEGNMYAYREASRVASPGYVARPSADGTKEEIIFSFSWNFKNI